MHVALMIKIAGCSSLETSSARIEEENSSRKKTVKEARFGVGSNPVLRIGSASRFPAGSWNPEHGFATLTVVSVPHQHRPAVGLGDLTAEKEADARACGLGGVEGDEQTLRISDSGSLVQDGDLEPGAVLGPTDLNRSTG